MTVIKTYIQKKYNYLRGLLWFIRAFRSVALAMEYERDRKKGITLDCSGIFNAEERKILEDIGLDIWNDQDLKR